MIYPLLVALLSMVQASHSPSQKLIIGGHETNIADYPHQGYLIIFYGEIGGENVLVTYCGCFVINSRWLLTASHCLPMRWNRGPSSMKVRLGISKVMEEGEIYHIELYKVHEKYVDRGKQYDITLVKTFNEIQFNKNIRPVALPPRLENVHEYKSIFASGFGMREESSTTDETIWSFALKAAELHMQPLNNCVRHYESHRQTLEVPPASVFFCAGYGKWNATHRANACGGDSGGAAVIKSNGSWVALGIAQAGFCWGHTLFCRLSAHLDWIAQTMNRFS